MKKRFIFLAFLLILTMVFSFSGAVAYEETDYSVKNTVRVGLKYGSSVVVAANAYSPTGYDIGYYEDDGTFVTKAVVENTFITAAKDKTVYVDGNVVSEETTDTSVRFGAYHLQLADVFESYDEAKGYAAEVKEKMVAAGYDIEVFPASYDDSYYVRIEHYSKAEYASADIEKFKLVIDTEYTPVGSSARAITFIDMNSPHIICEFEFSDRWVAASPHYVEEKNVYIRNGSTNYAGGFEYKILSGDNITLINVVSLKDYIMGVLPYEMSSSYPIEALRAQAICARCYYLGSTNKHSSYGFNVCDTTNCQVYKGIGGVTDKIREAVESTEGMIVVHGNKLVTTYFYSSNGGSSEDNSNVWGGTQYPYYKAVSDDFEELTVANYGKWSTTVSRSSLDLLAQKYGLSDMANIYVSQYTEAGNVYEITMVDSSGRTHKISQCDKVRTALSKYVKSARFKISTSSVIYVNNKPMSDSVYNMNVIGSGGEISKVKVNDVYVITSEGKEVVPSGDMFTFTGTGWGHNVGMSQLGAKGRANAGWIGEDIVKYYFTDTEVVVNSTLKG